MGIRRQYGRFAFQQTAGMCACTKRVSPRMIFSLFGCPNSPVNLCPVSAKAVPGPRSLTAASGFGLSRSRNVEFWSEQPLAGLGLQLLTATRPPFQLGAPPAQQPPAGSDRGHNTSTEANHILQNIYILKLEPSPVCTYRMNPIRVNTIKDTNISARTL